MTDTEGQSKQYEEWPPKDGLTLAQRRLREHMREKARAHDVPPWHARLNTQVFGPDGKVLHRERKDGYVSAEDVENDFEKSFAAYPSAGDVTRLNRSATLEWRTRATVLCWERGLHGRAYRCETREHAVNKLGREAPGGCETYRVPSVTEPDLHTVFYNPALGTVACDCGQGMTGSPCSHAGSVLLVVANITSESPRDYYGRERK